MADEDQPIVLEEIRERIVVVRGRRVLLDSDLARLYEVPTGRLLESVKRNIERFPDDFMFSLDKSEHARLLSQNAIANSVLPAHVQNLRTQNAPPTGRGGRRTLPYAFTEQGVAMLSSVLRSPRAVAVNIEIMRTFVAMRRAIASHDLLVRRLDELEQRYEGQFAAVFEAIRQLMEPPPRGPRGPLGFDRPTA
jgi:hypothetical protein